MLLLIALLAAASAQTIFTATFFIGAGGQGTATCTGTLNVTVSNLAAGQCFKQPSQFVNGLDLWTKFVVVTPGTPATLNSTTWGENTCSVPAAFVSSNVIVTQLCLPAGPAGTPLSFYVRGSASMAAVSALLLLLALLF